MSNQKPTGVFVRLPLREDQRELMVDAAALGQPDDSHDKAILAIGTPVTGGELAVVAYADPSDLPLNDGSECNWYTEVVGKPEDECTEGLVRQSDALAKLAERYHAGWVTGKRDAHLSYTRQIAEKNAEIAARDAEIVRLNEELSVYRAGMSELIAKEVALLRGGAA